MVGVPITRFAVPMFATVSSSDPETSVFPNARFAGLRFTCGNVGVMVAEACAELALVPAEFVALTT